jgi:acyl-coenzyme A thioesterase PaaI-like protein
MPGFRFDADTAGEVLDGHTVRVRLHPDWNVDGRILNGGYLQALAVRAAAAILGTPGEPVAVSTSFASPAVPGVAEVTVDVLRRGGRLSAVTATMHQNGAPILATLATFGVLADEPDSRPPTPATPPMPRVTGPDRSIRVPAEQMPGPPGLARLLHLAFVPEDSGWLSGDLSAGPHIRCWLSFADRRPLDPLAAIALADMAPPVSFAQGRFGWAPTLHLQVGVFGRPRGHHLLLDLRGEPYDGSFVAEDGLLWDDGGRLVARSRQIALAARG